MKIINNVICHNSAPLGGFYNGGGIFINSALSVTIENTTVYGNRAALDGGIVVINVLPGQGYITNSIIWGNFYGQLNLDSTISVTYCDIDGGWPGEGNIDCCPEFCSPGIEDFHLTASSCCLGAGSGGEDIGAFGLGCDSLTPNCSYVVGDVNGNDSYSGLDVIYGVNFLKGGPPPIYECECTSCNIWYASGDVNASCSYNGLDITYGVSYLKGIYTDLLPCPDCPPVR